MRVHLAFGLSAAVGVSAFYALAPKHSPRAESTAPPPRPSRATQCAWSSAQRPGDAIATWPARSDVERECSRQCLRSGRGGLFFQHMSKCGGQSLGSFLGCAAVALDLGRDSLWANELRPFSQSWLGARNTVFVTALRDPAARVVSLHRYAARRPDLRYGVAWSPDFALWLNRSVEAYRRPGALAGAARRLVFADVEQYYLKMLTSWHYSLPALRARGGDSRVAFELARATLEQFDVVLTTEQMGDPRASAALRRALWLEGGGGAAAGHSPPAAAHATSGAERSRSRLRSTRGGSFLGALPRHDLVAHALARQCPSGEALQLQHANSGSDPGDRDGVRPAPAPAASLDRLRRLNHWDVLLHREAHDRGVKLLAASGGDAAPAMAAWPATASGSCGNCESPGPGQHRMPNPDPLFLGPRVPECDGGV